MTISDPQKTILAVLRLEALPRGTISNRTGIPIMGCESSLRTMMKKGLVVRRKNRQGPDPWLYVARMTA